MCATVVDALYQTLGPKRQIVLDTQVLCVPRDLVASMEVDMLLKFFWFQMQICEAMIKRAEKARSKAERQYFYHFQDKAASNAADTLWAMGEYL